MDRSWQVLSEWGWRFANLELKFWDKTKHLYHTVIPLLVYPVSPTWWRQGPGSGDGVRKRLHSASSWAQPFCGWCAPTRFSWVSSLGRIWIFKKKQNWNMIGVLIFYLLQDEYVCICVFCFVVWSDLLELSIVSRGAVFMFCFFVKKISHFVSKCFHDQLLISCHPLLIFPSGINCKSHTSNKQGVSMTGMSQWVNEFALRTTWLLSIVLYKGLEKPINTLCDIYYCRLEKSERLGKGPSCWYVDAKWCK